MCICCVYITVQYTCAVLTLAQYTSMWSRCSENRCFSRAHSLKLVYVCSLRAATAPPAAELPSEERRKSAEAGGVTDSESRSRHETRNSAHVSLRLSNNRVERNPVGSVLRYTTLLHCIQLLVSSLRRRSRHPHRTAASRAWGEVIFRAATQYLFLASGIPLARSQDSRSALRVIGYRFATYITAMPAFT